ncbi:hypothetical protein FSP39_017481 [Pinctada imbricata]|uniref:Uncharacterized protein n=1 Tax=Pinctada imbricata TaxID=66713 RepID=A0AA89BI53_PINIB|nr:hypothetical protein FSP39_017481 [Pinctada imbricata]
MSSMYYRVDPPKPPSPRIGFSERTAKDIREITERLSRFTYARKLYSRENEQVGNYYYLIESGNRKRLPSASRERNIPQKVQQQSRVSSADSRRYNERDMSRLIRRLMKPTESLTAKSKPDMTDQDLKEGKIVRAKSASAIQRTEKMVKRIRRPTTASRAKDVNECHLCYEHETKDEKAPPDAFDYDYSDAKSLRPEELDYVVARVAQDTCSSAKGRRSCSKTPVYIDEVKIRKNLPLISGLGRSKDVNEITNRLHPKPRYQQSRLTPLATAISAF